MVRMSDPRTVASGWLDWLRRNIRIGRTVGPSFALARVNRDWRNR
jgi:hypothetical protein